MATGDNEFYNMLYLVHIYSAFALITIQKYRESIDRYEKASDILTSQLQNLDRIRAIHEIADFNHLLAIMLSTPFKPLTSDDEDAKLKQIKGLRKQYPLNKEVIKYHAIYVVQKKIEQELLYFIKIHKMSNKTQIMGLIDEKQATARKRREAITKSFDMQTAKKEPLEYKESPK